MTPPKVTRFYGRIEFANEVVQTKEVAFVHASVLNDPFDPYGFFETDFDADYGQLIKHVKGHHPGDLGWFRTHVPAKNWVGTVPALKAYMDVNTRSAFILSTSAAADGLEPQHNLYMWGHYGSGHRGVAIEFDTEKLALAVLAHHEKVTGKPSEYTAIWSQIEYVKTFPPISAEVVFEFMREEKEMDRNPKRERQKTKLETHYEKMSVIKSDVWQRECEWRLMWRNDASVGEVFKFSISDDCILNIYLGMRFAGDERVFVEQVKKNFPKAGIFKAKKRFGDLAVEFDRL